MATASRIPVTTTATRLTGLASVGGRSILVRPLTGTVYLGGADVTSATGFPLDQDQTFALDGRDDVYATTSSGTVTVAVLRTGAGA